MKNNNNYVPVKYLISIIYAVLYLNFEFSLYLLDISSMIFTNRAVRNHARYICEIVEVNSRPCAVNKAITARL